MYAPLNTFEDGIVQFLGQPCVGLGPEHITARSGFHPRTSVGTPSHGVIGIAGFFGEFATISCRTDLD